MSKKICFIVTSRAQYARNKLLMKLINEDPNFDLQVVVGGSALLSKYGEIVSDLIKEGFNCVEELYVSLEGGNNIAMAKTTGLAILEFTNTLQRLKPEMVVVMGDRFEVLAVATAAAYCNILVIHLEGGDISGTIDESVRHAVTKLSHVHFATNEESKKRLLRMGENPEYVYNVGSLDVEFVENTKSSADISFINNAGVGAMIDTNEPFIIVIQHPVTTGENNLENIQKTLKAVNELGIQAVWFWPNSDAGVDIVAHTIRHFRETETNSKIRFITHLPPEEFIGLLKKTACLVGNSSAGVKECSYLGVPVVNIGNRQKNRLIGSNVINVDYDSEEIKEAVTKQINHGFYPSESIYYQPNTSQTIIEILKTINPVIQKVFFDNNGKD